MDNSKTTTMDKEAIRFKDSHDYYNHLRITDKLKSFDAFEKRQICEAMDSWASTLLQEKQREVDGLKKENARLTKGVVDSVMPHLKELLPDHVKAMEKQNEELKKSNQQLLEQEVQFENKVKALEDERDELKKENDKLMGLIDEVWHDAVKNEIGYHGVSITDEIASEINDHWNEFKLKNNLPQH